MAYFVLSTQRTTSKTARVIVMIVILCVCHDCKKKHGFLKEHRTSMRFQWIKKGFPQQEISHGESGSSTNVWLSGQPGVCV